MMTIRDLTVLLEESREPFSSRLAGRLRDLCGELAESAQRAGFLPGDLDAEHVLRCGLVALVEARKLAAGKVQP